jgi:hypothetical protein
LRTAADRRHRGPGTPIAGPSTYLKLRDRLIDGLTLVEFDGGPHNIACAYPTR